MSNADPLHHLHELGQQQDSLTKTLKDASLRNGVCQIIEMVSIAGELGHHIGRALLVGNQHRDEMVSAI